MDLFEKLALLGSNLFTGRDPGGITPQQNRSATGQGLTSAGLRTILASQPGAGPGGTAPTALGAIAQGALAGQQVGGAARTAAQRQNALAGVDLSSPEGVAAALPAFLSDPDMFGEIVKLQGQLGEQTAAQEPDKLDLGDRVIFYDPTDPSKIVETILKTPDASEAENKLATEYATRIKDDIVRARALSNINAVASNAPSAAGDLSMVFGFMKLLDPPSSVREGEQANATNATGVPDRIRNLFNAVLEGHRLTPDQRKDFAAQANRIATSQFGILDQTMDIFRRRAESQNADPSLILFNPYEAADAYAPYDFSDVGTGPPVGVVPGETINPIDGKPVGVGDMF